MESFRQTDLGVVQRCFPSVNHSCFRPVPTPNMRGLLYTFLISMCLLTFCGNLLVISSILHFKQLHTPTNILILALAMTDLVLGSMVMPPRVVYTIEKCWYYGDLFCKFQFSAEIMLFNTSILIMFCISVDRYYAVCNPLRYNSQITLHTAVVMASMSWCVSALVGFGIVFGRLRDVRDVCKGKCFVINANVSMNSNAMFFSYYLPAIIILSLYLKIYLVAKRHADSLHTCQRMKTNAVSSKRERKAARTLAVVLGAFLSCWTPFFICKLVRQLTKITLPTLLFDIIPWICYSSSILNPFIYAFFYSWFRKALGMIISGRIFQNGSSTTLLMSD